MTRDAQGKRARGRPPSAAPVSPRLERAIENRPQAFEKLGSELIDLLLYAEHGDHPIEAAASKLTVHERRSAKRFLDEILEPGISETEAELIWSTVPGYDVFADRLYVSSIYELLRALRDELR
jgi:hypothetical protein